MRGMAVAVGLVVGTVVLSACGKQAASGPVVAASATPSGSAVARTAEPACAHPAEVGSRLLPVAPPGPAATAISGEKVTTTFELEQRFTAAPPPAGFTPAVSAAAAACQLTSLYATNGSGGGPGRLALATVTISGSGISTSAQTALNSGAVPHIDERAPATYSRRMAWILVTAANNDVSAGCPTAAPSNPPTPTGIEAAPYEVFVLDAATGADAVLFEDSYILCPGFAPTPPSVTVPWQMTSVPWTLQSRSSDGSTGRITASWPACEHFRGEGVVANSEPSPAVFTADPALQAWTDRDHPNTVTIDVYHFPGPDCGPATLHQITLHPATGNGSLPATLDHAPLGAETSEG